MSNDSPAIYRVGGCVRDRLLHLETGETPPSDIDRVVVGATPDWMEAHGFRPVGAGFPVFLHPDTDEEYALARTERKSGVGHRGFEFFADPSVSLEQDLLRRDLTINAMAETDGGELIDPYGGQRDLNARLLRHVSPAFREDPLRVLRVARFAARFAHLGFQVAAETMQLMREISASGELETLSGERVFAELQKALQSDSPSTFILLLRQCGALERLLPEVDKLFGVPQSPRYHPEIDTGLHLLLCLDRVTGLTNDDRVRFAILVHDLGKGITPAAQLPSHPGHEEAGVPLVESLCERTRVPNSWRRLAVKVSRWHLHAHRAAELRAATLEKLFSGLDLWRRPEELEPFILACQADARGRPGRENCDYPAVRLFPALLEAAQQVQPGQLVKAGMAGDEIAELVRQARIKAIASRREQL